MPVRKQENTLDPVTLIDWLRQRAHDRDQALTTMAVHVGGPNFARQVERWKAGETVGVSLLMVDRITELFHVHPTEIWGDAYYAPYWEEAA